MLWSSVESKSRINPKVNVGYSVTFPDIYESLSIPT